MFSHEMLNDGVKIHFWKRGQYTKDIFYGLSIAETESCIDIFLCRFIEIVIRDLGKRIIRSRDPSSSEIKDIIGKEALDKIFLALMFIEM